LIIKYLSKVPRLILVIASGFLVFYSLRFAYYLTLFIPASASVFFPIIVIFGSSILVFIILTRVDKVIQEFLLNENKTLIDNTDMSQLCLDMLEASQQKYKYTNFSIKLKNYSDWITYQSSQNRKMPLESVINNDDQKHIGTGTFVTFDTVFIAQNKFLDSLFHTNIILGLLEVMSVIEVNLLSDFNIDENYENIQLRIKIIRGINIFEIRYDLDASDKPTFQEIVFMVPYLGIFVERQASDVQILNVINFMQKFIKKTKKLIR